MNRINVSNRGPLKGEISTPPDKSISHRAIMLSSLATGKSVIRNFLRAEDPLCTLEAFRQMGIVIEDRRQNTEHRAQANEIVIHGKGLRGLREQHYLIDCGNSGTTMRLMSGILAAQSFSTVLTGDSSLRRRPMKRVITPLTEMGAHIDSEVGGYPPLKIKGGPLTPITHRSPVASAQIKSSVLLAGLYCDGVTGVIEPGKSRDHTERMLKACGADITIQELTVLVAGAETLNPLEITIPGDLSSAAFFIVAGLIIPGSEILIKNTGVNPTRAGILDILYKMGAHVKLENKREVSGEPVADLFIKHSSLTGIEIGGDLVLRAIDEFPILCVAAAKARGLTKITGAKELRVKESDRISVMAAALKKTGVHVEEFEDGLIIEGREELNPATIESFGDHRIAMSMAVAGLAASGETVIKDTDCVNTSFPGFMGLLESLVK